MKIEDMSRKELLAQLARLKYDGPVSYRKEVLRGLVIEASGKPADHNFKAITGTKAGKETFGGPGRPAGGVEAREDALFALFCRIAANHSLVPEELQEGDRALLRTLVKRGVVVTDVVNDTDRVWQLTHNNEEATSASDDALARWFAGDWSLEAVAA
jgi:hypothetical protein